MRIGNKSVSKRNSGLLVYSTETQGKCPECGLELRKCRCAEATALRVGDGTVKLRRETKGRKGKGVTLVDGVLLPDNELKELAKRLKQLCGTGGSLKQGVIEIQGDKRDEIEQELVKRGFSVKRLGG